PPPSPLRRHDDRVDLLDFLVEDHLDGFFDLRFVRLGRDLEDILVQLVRQNVGLFGNERATDHVIEMQRHDYFSVPQICLMTSSASSGTTTLSCWSRSRIFR